MDRVVPAGLPRRPVVAETCDFSVLESARHAWHRLNATTGGGIRARRDAFIAQCEPQAWAQGFEGTGKNRRKQLIIQLNGRVKLRDTKPNPDLADARAKLCQFGSTYVSAVEQHSHSKGAYQERAWMDERAALLGFWDEPAFREHAAQVYGRAIGFATFERIYRQCRGTLSPSERAMDRYVQHCLPDAPEYAGQYLQIDGTGIPVEVLNAWGRARNDGGVDQVGVALTDVASLRTWLLTAGDASEVYLWSPLLLKFFEQAPYAPEKILTDLGGHLFHTLSGQDAGEPIALDDGLKVALAVGVQPSTHSPHNARAKGTVESGGIKASKSALKRVLVSRVAKALFDDLATVPLDSHGHIAYRQISSESTWREVQAAWEDMLNTHQVKRAGDGKLTRAEVWALPEYAAKRAARALVSDWRERYRDVIARGFAMEVRGEKVLYWKGARAEVRTALGQPVEPGSVAVLFPGGLRKGDAEIGDELLRGVIIEPKPRGGMPSFHAIEALKIKKSFLGFDVDRPKVGEHPNAIPETEHERRKRLWVETGKVLPAAVQQAWKASGVKEATNDMVVR